MELVPENHLWKNEIVRVQFGKTAYHLLTAKKIALFQSINRHLFIEKNPKTFPSVVHIHPHHFSTPILKWRERNPNAYLPTPLSSKDAYLISKVDSENNRFKEFTTKCFHLHNPKLTKITYSR